MELKRARSCGDIRLVNVGEAREIIDEIKSLLSHYHYHNFISIITTIK